MLVLSGGTGTPKLLLGLKEILKPEEFSVVVNTAEDMWISGNYVSPDIDSVLYTLADLIDQKHWWGIKGDRSATYDCLMALGIEEKLKIGDKDRAVHIFRSELLRKGYSLSSATEALAISLGVEQRVVPMTDDPVSTMISTPDGRMHFQDFWVKHQGRPDVLSISFEGLAGAIPSQDFIGLLEREETILIGPSNPVTSIGPILALKSVRERLWKKKVVAISPFIGDAPVSGPAARFMSSLGVPASDEGVKSLLGNVDIFVVDKKSSYAGECRRMSTRMRTRGESLKVARELIDLISEG